MTKANYQSAAVPVAPRSTAQAVNIDAATTNSATFGGQEPIHETQSPTDFELVRQWSLAVVSSEVSVGRQRRITEGMRQITALTRTRDSLQNDVNGKMQERQARCPVTGKLCGEKGYGPYGIHSACAPLDISDYCK